MRMALAGKFLVAFFLSGFAKALLVLQVLVLSGLFCPAMLATSLAAPVRVLPDDFLSGNSEADRPESGKPEAGTGALARPAASVPDASAAKSGQDGLAGTARVQARGNPAGMSARTQAGLVTENASARPGDSALLPGDSAADLPAEDGWELMPAGAKLAYMGIHGGTMPVSLLVSNDGNTLLTFVGRTGNDFLDMLRRTELPLPSLFNSTESRQPGQIDLQSGLAGARVLSAGSGQARMPVLCLSADLIARIAPTPDMLQPFGLSDKPLALEGDVLPPDRATPAKQFRMFFQPHYLQPKAKPAATN